MRMKRTIEETEVSQTISLKEYLGWGANDPNIRDAFASDIIDRIVHRTTQENRDIKGKLFAAYSKDYIESQTFKIWGKSAGDINMTLTGDMLASLVSESNDREMTISLDGKENIIKAFANITGQRGKHKGKARDFFGVTDKELKSLASPYQPVFKKNEQSQSLNKKIVEALRLEDLLIDEDYGDE